MKIRIMPLVFILALIVPRLCQSSPWTDMTKQDLDFIYTTLQQNHPGTVDSEDGWFKKYLKDGYERGKLEADRVTNYNDYEALLRRYVKGFRDVHLGIFFKLNNENTVWTGFLVNRKNNEYMVVSSDNSSDAPKIGWTLRSCDGISPTEILKRDIFPYYGNEELDAFWFILSPYLLQGSANSWVTRYKECTFFDGKNDFKLPLKYKQISVKSLTEKRKEITFSKSSKFSIKQFGKKNIWISLPTFSPDENDVQTLKSIIKNSKRFRMSEYIVMDVRGNSGGSSEWGQEILSSIYGKEFTSSLEEKDRSFAEYRVSEGNLKHLEFLVPWAKERFGEKSDIAELISKTHSDMSEAMKKGETFIKQTSRIDLSKKDSDMSKVKAIPLSKARIIVLTDGYCMSACLDFLDLLKELPNVTQVGLPTNADTMYLEIRPVELPSQLASLSFATKVYRQRKRGHNEPYIPQYQWTGSMTDTKAIEAWISREVIPSIK